MVGLFLPVLVLWYWGLITLLRMLNTPLGVGVAGSPIATGHLPRTLLPSQRLIVRLPSSSTIFRLLVAVAAAVVAAGGTTG